MRHDYARIWVLALAALLFLLPAGLSAAAGKNESDESSESQKVRVLVAYYSLHGNTERFAQSVAEGAKQVPGTVVTIKKAKDVSKEDLQTADAIALGSATYFANIPGKMKVVIDDWNWRWKVDFTDKVGGAFSTGGGQTGGKEFVVISLLLFMINNRMVVAGPLYQDAEGEDIWGEAGASAMTGPLDPGVSEMELDAARRLGHRLATLAKKLQSK
jgi:NAD(P)H dehydrogenase (quinone)